MRGLGFLLLVSLLTTGPTSPSYAGANAKGQLRLSWDEAGVVKSLYEAPAQRFRLFVHLDRVPDIRELAIQLRWVSYDSSRTYRAVQEGSVADACGRVSSDGSSRAFGGDKDYDWQITWPPGLAGDSRCIAYTIEAPDGASPPATRFFVQRVFVMDSNGNIDTLRAGPAVTLGAGRRRAVAEGERFVPDVILVRFESGSVSSDSTEGLGVRVTSSTAHKVMAGLGLRAGRRIFRTQQPSDTLFRSRMGDLVKVPDLSAWYEFALPPGADPWFVANALRALPNVRGAAPNHISSVYRVPNDPHTFQQWQLVEPAGIGALGAWDITTGRSDVHVGVIDTGIDYTHADLDPGNRTHVLQGWDTAEDDSDPMEDIEGSGVRTHGTASAGVIGALTNNSLQGAGILWHCELHPWKAAQSDGGDLHDTDIADAINLARLNGDDVINMSFGDVKDPSFWQRIGEWFNTDPKCEASYAAYLSGVIQVAASGNDGANFRSSPAGYDWVIGVGSAKRDSTISAFSNYGWWVDVVAPGENLLTTARDNEMMLYSGTSAATPVVSGVAGLVIAAARDSSIQFSNDDVEGIITRSARDQGALGRDDYFGWGLVDARAAVQRLRPPYSTLRSAATGGTSWVKLHDNREVVFYTPYGPIAPGRYWADAYEVTRHIAFPLVYNGTPFAWGRPRDSYGLALDPPIDRMYTGVRNVTATGCDLVTYCYTDLIDVGGGRRDEWVPCPPANVVFAYTLNGLAPLQNGVINGSHASCAREMLSMEHGGGSGPVTYVWQWRRATEPEWSGVVASEKSYTPTWPEGDAYVVQCTASNNGVAVVDTHVVHYQPPCVVGVDTRAITDFEMSCFPNPVTGSGRVMLRIPRHAEVAIECIDVAGRVVSRKALGVLRAGQHQVDLGTVGLADGFASGVYFVRARVGEDARVLRIAVMK